MITFIIALLVLVGGYFLYGSYLERVFGPDKIRKTPALTMADGVDFIPPVSYTHLSKNVRAYMAEVFPISPRFASAMMNWSG